MLDNEADTITAQLRPATSPCQSRGDSNELPIQPDEEDEDVDEEWEFDVEACQTASMQKDDGSVTLLFPSQIQLLSTAEKFRR